ncbi:MAG: hypothetical protein HQK49_05200 [Oligoflexia bacterium]|nr:hypothetical protein [Oligoflexia bacterium]
MLSILKSKLISMLLSTLFLLTLVTLFGCNPLTELYKEIKQYGYIAYPTPLQYAGPGTMIGGSPKALNLIAAPETCFPDSINGVPTNLRKTDLTTLPRKSYKFSVGGNLKFKLLNFLNTGNPVLNASVGFGIVKTMELVMSGVSIEYLDSIKISEYYPKMSDICKQYLNYVGFIIQAIRVEKLSFQFRTATNALLQLSVENIKDIVDIGAGVEFSIDNSVTLNITTPKYIGYQLGELRQKNNGLVLYRANKIRFNKFVFVAINVFHDKSNDKNVNNKMIDDTENSNQIEEKAIEGAVVSSNLENLLAGELKELIESDLLEKNAVYANPAHKKQ